MNHEGLVNDVISALSSKELERTQKKQVEDDTPKLRIKLKMQTEPVEIPYGNVDWRTMSLPENMEMLKKNLQIMWEFSENLMQIPHTDNMEIYNESCQHVIGQVASFISGNFSIDLDYSIFKNVKPVSIAEEAEWYVDDGIRVIEAFIRGCEDYQLNLEFLMMQQQQQSNQLASMGTEGGDLPERILYNLIQDVPQGALRQDIDINVVLEKINQWLIVNIPEQDREYAMTHPSDKSDPEIVRINNLMMEKGFGKFMADLIINRPTFTNEEEDSIDEQIKQYAENDIIMASEQTNDIENDGFAELDAMTESIPKKTEEANED